MPVIGGSEHTDLSGGAGGGSGQSQLDPSCMQSMPQVNPHPWRCHRRCLLRAAPPHTQDTRAGSRVRTGRSQNNTAACRRGTCANKLYMSEDLVVLVTPSSAMATLQTSVCFKANRLISHSLTGHKPHRSTTPASPPGDPGPTSRQQHAWQDMKSSSPAAAPPTAPSSLSPASVPMACQRWQPKAIENLSIVVDLSAPPSKSVTISTGDCLERQLGAEQTSGAGMDR